MKNNRFLYLDNIPGILILSMIFLCHIRIISVGIPDDTILGYLHHCFYFINPWYFFRSGMFYRTKGIIKPINSSANKLLVPWFKYSLIAYIIFLFCALMMHEELSCQRVFFEQITGIIEYGAIPWNQPLWFLVTLFLIRFMYILIEPYIKKYIISIVSLFLAFYFKEEGLWSTFWIGTTCMGIFFFSMGDMLRNIQFNNYVFAISVLVYCLRYPLNLIDMWDARMNLIGPHDNYFVVMVTILSGIIMMNNIFKRWIDIKIPILSYIGRNSIFFFGFHFPLVMVLYFYILPFFNQTQNIGFIISCIIMSIYLALGVCVYSGKITTYIKNTLGVKQT